MKYQGDERTRSKYGIIDSSNGTIIVNPTVLDSAYYVTQKNVTTYYVLVDNNATDIVDQYTRYKNHEINADGTAVGSENTSSQTGGEEEGQEGESVDNAETQESQPQGEPQVN